VAAQALRGLTGLPIGLKWPNDLWLDGRKLGGILLDLVLRGPHPRLVAGLGLNLHVLPAGLPRDVRVRATALPTDPDRWRTQADVAACLLRRWDVELASFVAAGWRRWGAAYAEVDVLQGRRIELESGGSLRTGIAAGIDEAGALLLCDAAGRATPILAGDVHILETGGA
jgi:BirA family biotin operon repressor/biotin-[acetyl-CoA-carboxylase] ligase